MNKYKCNLNHSTGCVKDLGRICPGCFTALMARHNRMLNYIKDIQYYGNPFFTEEAEDFLKEIGAL